ncbi:MAG: TonB-dependent receptor [Proteobacteria bacterium]|nr:TonB-dependent receptor [Pseudomonadota bacterium]
MSSSRETPLGWRAIVSTIALVAFLATGAQAQEGTPETPESEPEAREEIEAIIVTAQKRSQRVQDVPISLTAITSTFLEDSGTTSFVDLEQYAPNLQITPSTDARSTVIRIRGIGSVGTNAGIDPSVGVFIDGVYQGRAGMSISDLLDIERVEVLRGPQGTLYGKNTAAGAINVISKRPAFDPEVTLEGVVATDDNFEGRASINLPLIDERVASRFSAYKVVRDGFDRNLFTGDRVNDADKYGLKSRTLFQLTDSFEILLSGDYSKESTDCCLPDILTYAGPSLLGVPFSTIAADTGIPLLDADPFDRQVDANEDTRNEVEIGGISLEANLDFGDHTITSLTSYRHYTSVSHLDGDFSRYNAVVSDTDVEFEQASSELRITSPGGEWLEYVGGLYFHYQAQDTVGRIGFREDFGNIFLGGLFPTVTNVDTNEHETHSYAAFGQATVNATDWLSFTGGLRVSHEKKTRKGSQVSSETLIDAPPVLGPDLEADESRKSTDVSGMASVRVFPMDDVMVYASWSRGFKSGGFNQLRTFGGDNTEFDDEKSNNYELGVKTSWFGRQLTANATAFFTDYEDFQSQSFDGTGISVQNAGRLRSYGVEADFILVPHPDVVLGTSVGFNIAEYESFDEALCTVQQVIDQTGGFPVPNDCVQDLKGETLDNAPEWSVSSFLSLERPVFQFPLRAFARVEYSFTDDVFLDQDLDSALKQEDTHLVNLRAGLRAENELWELTFWLRNASDEEWNVIGFDVPILSGYAGINGPPRTFGGTLRIRF